MHCMHHRRRQLFRRNPSQLPTTTFSQVDTAVSRGIAEFMVVCQLGQNGKPLSTPAKMNSQAEDAWCAAARPFQHALASLA